MNTSDLLNQVCTNSLRSRTDVTSFDTVVYEKRKSTKKQKEKAVAIINEKPSHEIDMKKARYDILKFGSKGFDTAKKEESKIALAVSLGAKPPKRKGINYKELLEAKRKTQQEALQPNARREILKKSKIHSVEKRKSDNLLKLYGKVQKQEVHGIKKQFSDKNRKKRK